MKNILFLLIPFFAFGQTSFTLKETENFVSINEDYVVVPFEGKTATELYKSTSNAIQEIWVNPTNVQLGSIEDQFIRITFNGGFANFSKFSCNPSCHWGKKLESIYEFRFKDGKIRIDLIISDDKYPFPTKDKKNKNILKFYGTVGFGFKATRLRTNQEALTFLEEQFVKPYNTLIDLLSDYINNGGLVDDW
jgi:hypothetical protein